MARQPFEPATVLPLDLVMRPGFQRPQSLRPKVAKPTRQQEQGSLALLVQAKRKTPRELLQGKLLAKAKLQQRPLHPEGRSPVPLEPVRRCSRGPGPCAFSPETPAGRKCSRAARCGDHPISARYHLLRNRRGVAGCDNKCNRSQRKRAPRVRPFLIAAADKYRCLPRRTGD